MSHLAGKHVRVTATTEPVVIWSGEHRAYWGPHRSGYVRSPDGAGRYSLGEAIDATHHCGPEKLIEILNEPAPSEIARLRAMNARLVGALESVVNAYDDETWGTTYPIEHVLPEARAAIEAARSEG